MATHGLASGSEHHPGKKLALTAVAGIAAALGCGPQPPAAAPALQVADPAASPPFGSDTGYASDDPKERTADPPEHPTARVAARAKDCCKGLNECKGKGNCKVTGSQDCKGKNECKGKGGCKAADCTTGPGRQGAGAERGPPARDCCKGMNECKGKGNCKVDGAQDCKGRNDCKGKGGCKSPDC